MTTSHDLECLKPDILNIETNNLYKTTNKNDQYARSMTTTYHDIWLAVDSKVLKGRGM